MDLDFGINLLFERRYIMGNIGQLAVTLFGFGLAFYAIWLHYDGKKKNANNKKYEKQFKWSFFGGEAILAVVFLLTSCPYITLNISFAWIGLLFGTILVFYSICISGKDS